jgi:hypothetical protein
MDLKAKTITMDEVTLPVTASTMQSLIDSLAKETISTQVAIKRATWMLDVTKTKKQISSQLSKTIASI